MEISITLVQIPNLTLGLFSREHVIQGGEEASLSEAAVVHHYFGVDKHAFLSEISKNFGFDRL